MDEEIFVKQQCLRETAMCNEATSNNSSSSINRVTLKEKENECLTYFDKHLVHFNFYCGSSG